VTAAEEFTEFATGASPRLRRTAFLLCGNWHTAEDLAQTTLAKMFVSWRRIAQRDAVYAYANRTLVNTYLADRRRLRARELLAGWLPERAAAPQTPELRIVVMDALATLPPKARVVVVMRYWADLSVNEVAELLGCSPGSAGVAAGHPALGPGGRGAAGAGRVLVPGRGKSVRADTRRCFRPGGHSRLFRLRA
jgi:RNA polymerase sigma-70 factor (sigma-E family)